MTPTARPIRRVRALRRFLFTDADLVELLEGAPPAARTRKGAWLEDQRSGIRVEMLCTPTVRPQVGGGRPGALRRAIPLGPLRLGSRA